MNIVTGTGAEPQAQTTRRSYLRRILIAVGVVTATGLIALLFWHGAQVVLLLFAGLLLAVFLRSLSDWLSDHTPLTAGSALAVVLLGLVGLLGLGVWLAAPTITQQAQEFVQRLPQSLEQLRRQLRQLPFGERLLQGGAQGQQLLSPSPRLRAPGERQPNGWNRKHLHCLPRRSAR